jgi:hypothetical protein
MVQETIMTDYSQVDAGILQERQRILKIIEGFENELLTVKSKISFTDENLRDEYNYTIGGISALKAVRTVINL